VLIVLFDEVVPKVEYEAEYEDFNASDIAPKFLSYAKGI
jgi:hypothetical protein